MNLKCILSFHKWDNCKCSACGKTREWWHDWSKDCETCAKCHKAKPAAHVWSRCKCSKCDKTRDEGHDWSKDCETCAKCHKARTGTHVWGGCKCSTCGKIRDEGHDWSKSCETCAKCHKTRTGAHVWSGCKCSTCGKTRNEGHKWNGCKCSTCGSTRDKEHTWGGCTCSTCGRKHTKGRTYVDGERGWDGCTGHDWSGGYRRCLKCDESGYEICTEAISRSRLSDPGQYVNPEDEERVRANPKVYLEIVESLLKLGMDPRQNYWTDGYVYTSALFSNMGKGEGPDLARPLICAISYDCLEVIKMMEAYGTSLKSPCAGKSLLAHANQCGSEKVAAYLSGTMR